MIIQFPITNPLLFPIVKSATHGDPGMARKKKDPNKVLQEFLTFDPLAEVRQCPIRGISGITLNTKSPSFGTVTPTNHYDFRGQISGIHGSLFTPSPANGSFTVLWPKNPLRLITARAPQYVEGDSNGTLRAYAYLETLECGHQVFTQPQFDPEIRDRFKDVTAKAKRRRCPECKALATKKASTSETGKKDRGIA